jgi:hypothetical protein
MLENQELNKPTAIILIAIICISFAGGFLVGYLLDLRNIRTADQKECYDWIQKNCAEQFTSSQPSYSNISIGG